MRHLMSNRSEVQNHLQAAGAVDRSSVVEVFLKGVLAGCCVVPVHDIEVRARDAGLLGRHQSITDSKTFKAAKKNLAIRSVRIGFSRGGWWGWALLSPETSAELAIEAPTSVIYGEDHSRPDQYDQHTGAGANDQVGVQPDPPETSVELAIEAPISVVYGEDHSRPHQCDQHSGTGANDHVSGQPDPVPSEWSRGIARLDHGHAPHGVPLHRWRRFVTDCHVFMTAPENWFIRARALGWDTVSLFGCCSTRPLDHLGRAGLLWNLAGGKLTQLHKYWAMISAPDDSQRTFHRRPFAADGTLPWMLR
jgi:hypothetical protein